MLNRFTIVRALYRLIASPGPVSDGLLVKTCFCAMARENFGMRCRDVGELAFEGRSDTTMELPASAPEQGAVRGVSHERMLEQECRLRGRASLKDKSGIGKAI
jgi:hypothetical protein